MRNVYVFSLGRYRSEEGEWDWVCALLILWEQGGSVECVSVFRFPWCMWGVGTGLVSGSGRGGGVMSV